MVMKEQRNKKKNGKVRMTFVMPALEGCHCLYLVGKFDEWNESVYRMQRADDGTWFLVLELESGREYQYGYRTDNGIWHNDSVANGYVPNPDSLEKSVVRV